MSKYNVDDAWPIEKPIDVDDCLKKLVSLFFKSGNKLECHGASMLEYKRKSSIRSKFDIRFYKKNNKNKNPKVVEKYLLRSFIQKAKPHFPSEAQQFIDVAHLKWDTLYNTGTLFIGRHYRLPTRCVDWTTNPLIALFLHAVTGKILISQVLYGGCIIRVSRMLLLSNGKSFMERRKI